MEPKQVIVMRKDLNMRKGKMIAQGAHASLAIILNSMTIPYRTDDEKYVERKLRLIPGSPLEVWVNSLFKKVVVGAESLSECVDVYEKAKKNNIPCVLIEDKGLTEFGGEVTITCCAIGPDDPEKIDKITGHLKLL